MAYFEMAYSVMTYFEMAYFEMEYFEMAYFLNVSKNKTRLQPSWMEPSTLRPMIRDATNCSHVEEKVYYYFVWFPLTELKSWVPQAAFSLSFGFSWQPYNRPRSALFSRYWINRMSQGSRFFFSTFFCNTSTLYRMKGSDFLILWGKGATYFFLLAFFFLVCFFFKGIKAKRIKNHVTCFCSPYRTLTFFGDSSFLKNALLAPDFCSWFIFLPFIRYSLNRIPLYRFYNIIHNSLSFRRF